MQKCKSVAAFMILYAALFNKAIEPVLAGTSLSSSSLKLDDGPIKLNIKRTVSLVFLLFLLPCLANAELTLVSSCDTPNYANGVVVSGNYAYVADGYSGLRVIDISNPASPMEVGSYDTTSFSGDVKIFGNYAYVSDAFSGLRIIDISNPANPVEVGFYDTEYAWSVAISGSYAYVADYDSGLRIIDISNPVSPIEVGSYDTPGNALDVAIVGNYAYVADDNSGLRIIDVSNPTSPKEVGFYDTPSVSFGVAVSGNYAYVADGYSGLRIIDISNPADPIEVGFYDMDYAQDLVVSGSHAYVADYGSGLRVIDISTPTSPMEVDSYDTPSLSFDVAISGRYVYVADYISGLQILESDLLNQGITIAIEPSAITAAPGDFVDFKIKVTNTGNFPLELKRVDDTLPLGMIYRSSGPAGGSIGRIIAWNDIGQLNPGCSKEIDVSAQIESDASGELVNIASVKAIPLYWVGGIDEVSGDANCKVLVNQIYSSNIGEHFHVELSYKNINYEQLCYKNLEDAYSYYKELGFQNGVSDRNDNRYLIMVPGLLRLRLESIFGGLPFGRTVGAGCQFRPIHTYSEILDNLYASSLQDTCYHEYFHAIQNTYDPILLFSNIPNPDAPSWITEGTAKLMGNLGYLASLDKYYIDGYLSNSNSLFGAGGGYNAAFYWYFISNNAREYYGGISTIKDVFEQIKEHKWANYKTAICHAYHGTAPPKFATLDGSFILFAKANLFAADYYPHILLTDGGKLTDRITRNLPITNIDLTNTKKIEESIFLDLYGVQYFKIKAPQKDVRVSFSSSWRNYNCPIPAPCFVIRFDGGLENKENLREDVSNFNDLLVDNNADGTIYAIGRVGGVSPNCHLYDIVFEDITLPITTTTTSKLFSAGTSTVTTTIEPNNPLGSFETFWPGSTLNLSLESPGGMFIDYNATDPNVIHVKNDTFEYYTVKNPEPGNWTMTVKAVDVPPEGEMFTATAYVQSNLTLDLSMNQYRYDPGLPIILQANLSNNGTGLVGADVWAEIESPSDKDNLTLYDDGTHSDAQASDGIYTNAYSNTAAAGTYVIKARVNGTVDGYPFTREDINEVLIQLAPDLIVSNLTFSDSHPSSGTEMFINATIKNIGEADATGFAAKFLDLQSSDNATEIGSNVTLSNLPSGQSLDISLPWLAKSGNHDIYMNITSLDLEKNESNNMAHKTLYVTPIHKLSIIQAGTDRLNYEPGDNVTLYCMVENADRDLFSPDKVYAKIGDKYLDLTEYSPGIFTVEFNRTQDSGKYFVRFWAIESGYINDSFESNFEVTSYYYPDFTDTANPNSWRSWLIIQNPNPETANVTLQLRSRAGDQLYQGSRTIPAHGAVALRPRDLAGTDCSGSAVLTSNQTITGSCQVTRNSNEMCMGYNAFDHTSSSLYFPDFTDTAIPDSWRSWLVLQNPHPTDANIALEIRSRSGDLIYAGNRTIAARGVSAIRPRDLAGADLAGSVVVNSDKPIAGTCQITRNSNKMCMSYSAFQRASVELYYPDFTDTANPDSWRSWLVLQNPTSSTANITVNVRSRSGDLLFNGDASIPPYGVSAVRPRSLVGSDCAGSVVVTSDQPIVGTCQITRNSNEMCMSYNALDQASTMLSYPDFTDTVNPDSWRSWIVLQNPTAAAANTTLDIRSRTGDLLYRGSQTIPAHGVNAIRPRSLVGSDCTGSVVVTSDQPIVGTCQISRNNNLMCMSYTATRAASVDWLPPV